VSAAAECIPFTEAGKHIGDDRCVTGKVLHVNQTAGGTTFVNFCEDYRVCPFTVVVFRGDLKHVGDVRQLAGRTIAISGEIKDYDGRAEIILREMRQLNGEAASIPGLPKGYDVEKKGRYSAGKFSHPKSKRKTAKKRQPAPVPIEDPADPSAFSD
jgi:DNA/RNA endonuclease YhcR with UshA esterase domain